MQWLGYSYNENPDIWIEASPTTYVNSNTPPVLFINSSIERFRAGRNEAIKILSENKIYYEVHEIPHSPHSFWLFKPWFKDTLGIIISYLNKVFTMNYSGRN